MELARTIIEVQGEDMARMKKQNHYRLRDDLVVEEIDGEVIVLDLAGNRYFGLNGVGWSIWKEISADRTGKEEIISRLVAEYQITEPQARRDVDTFLEELVQAGLATFTTE